MEIAVATMFRQAIYNKIMNRLAFLFPPIELGPFEDEVPLLHKVSFELLHD